MPVNGTKYSLEQVKTDPVIRNLLVRNGLLRGNGELLFLLAVDQYNERPAKLKAITIYDVFCSPNRILSSGDLGDNTNQLQQLRAFIDWFRSERQKASQMNFISRVRSSGDRQIAAPGLFNLVVANIVHGALGNGKDAPIKEALIYVEGIPQIAAFETGARNAARALKSAGFDTADLGLATFV